MWPKDNDEDKDSIGIVSPFDSSFNWNSPTQWRSWLDETAGQISSLLNDTTGLTMGNSLSELASAFGSSNPLTAYKVPSIRQYDECKSQEGSRSVWTEDGVWRCLFKGQRAPEHLKLEFTDITGFLDYQRKLLQTKRKEEATRMQEIRKNRDDITKWTPFQHNPSAFPGGNRPRIISEEEAKGKKVVWESSNSEAYTLEDGTCQTRAQHVKYFDDGTATISRNEGNGSEGTSSSWFWK